MKIVLRVLGWVCASFACMIVTETIPEQMTLFGLVFGAVCFIDYGSSHD